MEEFRRITKKAINFVFLIAVPLTCYFILYAKEGILFLSGNEYMPAVLPMQIIMPTIIFIGLTNIMGIQMLVPMGLEKVVLYSEIAGAIVDLILNTLLIPRLDQSVRLLVRLLQNVCVDRAVCGIEKRGYTGLQECALVGKVFIGNSNWRGKFWMG